MTKPLMKPLDNRPMCIPASPVKRGEQIRCPVTECQKCKRVFKTPGAGGVCPSCQMAARLERKAKRKAELAAKAGL